MSNRKKIYILLLILLGISVGFSAIATTLKINGTTNIGKNTWSVYWDSVGNVSKSSTVTETVGARVKPGDNTSVEFNITLNQPGDYYEFQVDAVNAGSLDAMINVVSVLINDDENATLPPYISYSIKYADDTEIAQYHLLERADTSTNPITLTRERMKIRVEFLRSVTEAQLEGIDDSNDSYDIEIGAPYVQADNHAIDRKAPPAANYSTDTWKTIARDGASAATQTSVTDGECGAYHLGDTKTIYIDIDGDNTPEPYVTRIANCSTPTICNTPGFSQSACGFVIEFVDILGTRNYNPDMTGGGVNGTGSKGGWEYSDIRAWLNNGTHSASDTSYENSGVFGKIPSEISSHIINTTVVSGYGTADNANFTTSDRLYLISGKEIWNENYSNWDTAADLTRQLDYYAREFPLNNNSCETAAKPAEWWTRTVRGDSDHKFAIAGFCIASSSMERGIAPAFRLG